MAKKGLDPINTGEYALAQIEAAAAPRTKDGRKAYKPRVETTPEEQELLKRLGRTQGHKGAKMGRINLGFTKDNYEYIETMSVVLGMTKSAFINHVIADYRERNNDEETKKLILSLRKKMGF